MTASSLEPHVLHIWGDFWNQSAFFQLALHLAAFIPEQTVFVPGAGQAKRAQTADELPESLLVTGGASLSPLSRPFLRLRSLRSVQEIQMSELDSGIDVVHSHMLFSDGLVGDRIASELGIPHIVSVRTTDRHLQWRYRLTLRKSVRELVRRCASVVFLNPCYRSWGRDVLMSGDDHDKGVVIPNGVAPFWIEHQARDPQPVRGRPRVLYVGDFSRNKNVRGLVRACSELSRSRDGVDLRLVGAQPTDASELRRITRDSQPAVRLEVLPRTENREVLRDAYRWSNVVVLPSFRETFGVSLAEALSQGRPVVCSRGEALSGYYSESSGVVQVDPHSPRSIADGIERALNVPAARLPSPTELSQMFGWDVISSRLARIYGKAIGQGATTRRA